MIEFKLGVFLSYINKCGGNGATHKEIKKFFNTVDESEIDRIIEAAMLLGDIKKNGKGSGVRYYGKDVNIIEIDKTANTLCLDSSKRTFIDGVIDVSDCTGKDKIKRVLESDHPLSTPILLDYYTDTSEKAIGRELHDFINTKLTRTEVRLMYDSATKKNKIYFKKDIQKTNSVWVGFEDDQFTIKKYRYASPDNPEVKKFDTIEEMNKCLRTFQVK